MRGNMKLQKALVGFVGLFIFCNCALTQQDGSLDITFNPGSGATIRVAAVALCTNGQVLIGGGFRSVNEQPRQFVARLNSDGSVDPGFLPLQGPDNYVFCIAPDSNGDVYIGGMFTSFAGIGRRYFARLRPDASLDVNWPNVAFSDQVTFVQRRADGTLLVGGKFSQIGSVARCGLAKLNSDASVNLSFNPAAGVNDGSVYAFAMQPDGNVIIAGNFTTNSPVSRQCIARVSESGVLDSTFNAEFIGEGCITAVALQPDGKVVVGGSFTSINGYSRLGIARLHTNGTVDTSFVLPCGITRVYPSSRPQINLLSSGKVLVYGEIAVMNQQNLARLNPDGSLDSTFNPQVGPYGGSVESLQVQPDGKILVGGFFTSIGGTNINRIARLNGTSTNTPALQFLGISRYAGMFVSGIVSNNYRVEWTTNLNTPSLWTPLLNVTLQTDPQFVLDPNPITGRQRFYRAIELP
jgi:uncharacterized delta-60 repeat protein